MLKIYFRISGHLRRFTGSMERDREDKMENARGKGSGQRAAGFLEESSSLERRDSEV